MAAVVKITGLLKRFARVESIFQPSAIPRWETINNVLK